METELDFVNTIRTLAKPFARGEYVNDWQQRAIQLSTISDFYTIRLRENAFLTEEKLQFAPCFASLSPLRKAIQENFYNSYYSNKIGYAISYNFLSDWQYDIFHKIYSDVDSSERIVMSACAYAICNLSCPIEVVLVLCNLLYEEALHLESISTLLGIDQSCKPWIGDDKVNHWQLISKTNTIISYLFAEHCLYEGRGFIAAAKGVYELQKYGTESTIYKIAKFIFEQETNHVLTGYFWLKQLDNGKFEDELRIVLNNFIKTEPMKEIESFKGKRQRFPIFIAENYLKNRDYWQIRKIVLETAKHIIVTGEILVSDEQLITATKNLSEFFMFCD